MKQKTCQEKKQNFFVVPEDTVQVLPVSSNVENALKDSKGHFQPLNYKKMKFSAGEVLELLPENDQTFDVKKRLTLDLARVYSKISYFSSLDLDCLTNSFTAFDFYTVVFEFDCYCDSFNLSSANFDLLGTSSVSVDLDQLPDPDVDLHAKLSKRWNRRVNQLTDCNMFMQTKGGKIFNASFCRVRLCPLCSWRRSLKIAVHTRKIISAMIQDQPKTRFIFATFTVPNVWDDDLKLTLDKMLRAWKRMTNAAGKGGAVAQRFNRSVLGWYRGLEITRNMDYYKTVYYKDKTGKKKKMPVHNPGENGFYILNPLYKSYHPHFHCILAVPEYYGDRSKNYYIDRQEWLNMWRWAMDDQRITQVDVREIKPNKKLAGKYRNTLTREQLQALAVISAVEEATHYTVKSNDYILDAKATRTLDLAIERRQLVAYGGLMADYKKKLKLDDEIDGDLINLNETELESDAAVKSYAFSVGFGHYIRVDRN